MRHSRRSAPALLLLCLPLLGACSSDQSDSSSLAGMLGSTISGAMDEAQAKLRSEPITVSHDDSTLPKAQITPQGDFIVGGKTETITPAQRDALLAYREQVIAVASEGIAVGKQGAAIGVEAAGAALAAVMSGKSDKEVEDSVKAKTNGIRESVVKLCDRLPMMMAEQHKLAAVLPAFRPYATMTNKDIDDCRNGTLHGDDTSRAEVQHAVRDRIRSGIRSGVRTAAQGAGLASRGTSDAAPASAASAAH